MNSLTSVQKRQWLDPYSSWCSVHQDNAALTFFIVYTETAGHPVWVSTNKILTILPAEMKIASNLPHKNEERRWDFTRRKESSVKVTERRSVAQCFNKDRKRVQDDDDDVPKMFQSVPTDLIIRFLKSVCFLSSAMLPCPDSGCWQSLYIHFASNKRNKLINTVYFSVRPCNLPLHSTEICALLTGWVK